MFFWPVNNIWLVKWNKLNSQIKQVDFFQQWKTCPWLFPKSKAWSHLDLLWRVPNFKEWQCAKPCQNSCQNCGWMRRPEVILEIRKKAEFLKVINNLIIYKFFKEFINHKKKTNRAVVFSCRYFPSIFKYCDRRLNFPKIKRSRFIQTQIEEFSWYIWKFRFTVLQNYHWNTMKIRNPWVIKVDYDPT